MVFDKEVEINSFWLRLHRSPEAWVHSAEGTRFVRIYLNQQLVADTTFLLTTNEWVLIQPSFGSGPIIGNKIAVQGMTDIDSIRVTGHGGANQFAQRQNATVRTIQTLQALRVVENPDKNSKFDYVLKAANNTVGKRLLKDIVLKRATPLQQNEVYKPVEIRDDAI